MDRLNNLTPFYETPLVTAMAKAKADLQGKAGFKTLLVLTDGDDTVYAKVLQGKDRVEAIREKIRQEFGGVEQSQRIMINMVLFNNDQREIDKAKDQFKEVIESLNSLNPNLNFRSGWYEAKERSETGEPFAGSHAAADAPHPGQQGLVANASELPRRGGFAMVQIAGTDQEHRLYRRGA